MKNTKKAFTLVELIVVITILAVLATVAFISLTGHAQDAKNSKVSSDLRTLASAIETKATKDGVLATSLVTAGFANNTMMVAAGTEE
jgi:prepilin-type N-terminal cleavage/methylation domain-containing protein